MSDPRVAYWVRQNERLDEAEATAFELAFEARRQIDRGVVGAVAAAETSAEMVANITIFFRRLEPSPWSGLLRDIAEAALIPFAEAEWARLLEEERAAEGGTAQKGTRQEEEAEGLIDGRDAWEEFVQRYLEERSEEFTGQVEGTTRRDVMGTLQDILDEDEFAGANPRDIARELDSRLEGLSRNRANVIARTETAGAANRGTLDAGLRFAEERGVQMVKEYIATMDGRTRETHASANGQIVPIDEPFTVGGYSMMHPADSSMGAPVGEVAQCRCAMATLFRDDVDEADIF